VLLAGACLLGAVAASPGRADDVVSSLGDALRAEVTAVSPVYNPGRPVWVRFVLHNVSNEPVSIPMLHARQNADGIRLPDELALGTPSDPWVTVRFDDEAPKTITPPEIPDPAFGGLPQLRLAAQGYLGTAIDLRTVHQAVRYPGSYRLDWRPLGGELGVVTTTFRVETRKDAIIVTDQGKLTFQLMYDAAPKNVTNFTELAANGFYNDLTFHRVVPGRLIQGGCPKGNGKGKRSDGKLIAAELHDIPIDTGTLAMARTPSDPDTASCQFFIALTRLEHLDGQYTVIGKAQDDESLRTLQQIARVDTDDGFRPESSLYIRSIVLVEAEGERVRNLSMRAVNPKDDEEQPDKPRLKRP
jgi:cyclophilin family peptidyl-prolyl cis-trans isomerase